MAGAQVTPTNPNTNTNQSRVTSISDAYSNITGLFVNEINSSATVIHGGAAGGLVEGCASSRRSSTRTCDNCSDNFASCNSRRVHNDLNLTIQFRPSSTATDVIGGQVFVTNNIDPTQAEFRSLDIIQQSPAGLIIPGNVVTVSVTVNWGDICEKFFGGSAPTGDTGGCEDAEPGQQTIRLGIDENNDNQFDEQGVTEVQISLATLDIGATTLCVQGDPVNAACNFVAYPGDKKVFIEDVRTDCSFPRVGDSTIESVRVFYEELTDGTTDVPNASSSVKDLAVANSSGTCSTSKVISFANNIVDGLQNGETYRFSIGLLDQANNLGGIIDMTSTPTDLADTSGCYVADPDFPANCHVASPDEVLGLIEKEFDCFITTAAYGSPFRPKVEDFRAFRNRYLHSHWLGRQIIKFYYNTSPPVAEWIRNHPDSKPVVRGILYPLWLFAKACLLYPFLTLSTLLLGFFSLFWRRRLRGVKQ